MTGRDIPAAQTRLRPTEPADLAFVLHAERDSDNAAFVGQWSFERHAEALADPDARHMIIEGADGRRVGYAILRGIESPNDAIELMRIVVTEKGAGHGARAIALIKRWCFLEMGAHRLWLDVRTHNERAQRVYESLGFVREGLLRDCVKVDGAYQSLVVMSVLAGE